MVDFINARAIFTITLKVLCSIASRVTVAHFETFRKKKNIIALSKFKLFCFLFVAFWEVWKFWFFLWKKENYLNANLRVSASGLPQIQIVFQQMLNTQIDLFQSFLLFCWFLYIEQSIKYSASAVKKLHLRERWSAFLWVAATCRCIS